MATFAIRKQRKYSFGEDRYTSMCVYKITNTINGKVYIGQSRGVVAQRWRNHINASGNHISAIRQAIRKYGFDKFIFSVIDTALTNEDLNKKEEFWINELNTIAPNGYNLCSGGNLKKEFSEETKKKMSISGIARWNGVVGKNRKRLLLTDEEKETLKKIRIAKMAETKKGKPSPRKGVKLSDEIIKKMRESRIGKEVKARWKKIIRDDGLIYPSVKIAVKEIGCNKSTLMKHLNGKLKTVYGRTYAYVEEVCY